MFSHAFLKLNKNESKLVHTKLYSLKVIRLFCVTLSKSYKPVRTLREWIEYGELTHSTEVKCNLLRYLRHRTDAEALTD